MLIYTANAVLLFSFSFMFLAKANVIFEKLKA